MLASARQQLDRHRARLNRALGTRLDGGASPELRSGDGIGAGHPGTTGASRDVRSFRDGTPSWHASLSRLPGCVNRRRYHGADLSAGVRAVSGRRTCAIANRKPSGNGSRRVRVILPLGLLPWAAAARCAGRGLRGRMRHHRRNHGSHPGRGPARDSHAEPVGSRSTKTGPSTLIRLQPGDWWRCIEERETNAQLYDYERTHGELRFVRQF